MRDGRCPPVPLTRVRGRIVGHFAAITQMTPGATSRARPTTLQRPRRRQRWSTEAAQIMLLHKPSDDHEG
jgi:hypothetical protein